MLKNQRGQGLTEYIILLFLVAVVSIPIVTSLAKTIRSKVEQAKEQIDSGVTLKAGRGE